MKISYSLWFPSHLKVVLILLKFQIWVYYNIPARFKLMSLKVWENSSVTSTLAQLARSCPWFSLITLSTRNKLVDLQKCSIFSSSDDFCRPSRVPESFSVHCMHEACCHFLVFPRASGEANRKMCWTISLLSQDLLLFKVMDSFPSDSKQMTSFFIQGNLIKIKFHLFMSTAKLYKEGISNGYFSVTLLPMECLETPGCSKNRRQLWRDFSLPEVYIVRGKGRRAVPSSSFWRAWRESCSAPWHLTCRS